MSPWVTVKWRTYDNAQRHVTAFRPISEAAHSLSYDNVLCNAHGIQYVYLYISLARVFLFLSYPAGL